MTNKALDVLNSACVEAGVCPEKASVPGPGPTVKQAAELSKDGSNQVVRIVAWSDGAISSCVVEKAPNGQVKEEVCCHTEPDGGEALFKTWKEFLCSPELGYKAKEIEVESV